MSLSATLLQEDAFLSARYRFAFKTRGICNGLHNGYLSNNHEKRVYKPGAGISFSIPFSTPSHTVYPPLLSLQNENGKLQFIHSSKEKLKLIFNLFLESR